MDVFQSFTQRQNGANLHTLLDFTPLSKAQKTHMSYVYGFLGMSVCVCALGVYSQINYVRIHTLLCVLGKIACLIGLSATSMEARLYGKVASPARLGMFFGFSAFLGMSIGDYLEYVHHLHPSIIPTAFFGSLSIFTCFSLAGIFAKERKYLYLGSILSSVLTYMCLTSLANLFIRSTIVNDIMVYLGLFVYIAFVLYDTQITIADFNNGNKDYLHHAISLFVDLVGIFLRLVQIMTDNERKRRRDKDRD